MSSVIPGFRLPTFRESIDPNKGIPASWRVLTGKELPAAKVPDVPSGPAIEDAAGKAQDESDRIRKRQGRAAAVVNDNTVPMTASKYLLGA